MLSSCCTLCGRRLARSDISGTITTILERWEKGTRVSLMAIRQRIRIGKGLTWLPAIAVGILLAGCSSTQRDGVSVVDRNHSGTASSSKRQPVTSGQYRVQRGDTLYSIAFRFGWDWKALAARNGIPAPYVIRPGQIIRFDVQPGQTRQTAVAAVPVVTKPRTGSSVSSQPSVPATQPAVRPQPPSPAPVAPAPRARRARLARGLQPVGPGPRAAL